jgi:hypothetical protein
MRSQRFLVEEIQEWAKKQPTERVPIAAGMGGRPRGRPRGRRE